MTVFEEHLKEMYGTSDVANEAFLDDIASKIRVIGDKLKSILTKIFIGTAYYSSTDPKVIRDYMMYTNAKLDGVNIFSELFNNAEAIKALTVQFNDATTEAEVSKVLASFREYEKKLDDIWKKYIPDKKDLYEVIQVSFTEYNKIVYDINVNIVPNLEDLLPFMQTVIDNTKKRFPTKSKELQSLFDTLFVPYFDMMGTLLVHLYFLPAPSDCSTVEVVEDFPEDKKPWFFLWDMPVFRAKINGSAFMYNILPSYQGRSKYPKGAIFVDEKTFHLMPDYYQMFVLYHEYGHGVQLKNGKTLLMSNNAYYTGECLADLFAYAIMGKDLDTCVKAFKKLIDVYVKYYKCNRDFMASQVQTRINFLTTAVSKGRGNTYDDIISLQKMTDVLKERFK